MKAIIMAGGLGSRLRPLTCEKPKPLINVLDKPVIEHIIELLKKHHITDIAVTLKYMSHNIMEYLGDGGQFGVRLFYFIEDKPLGTAGGVKNAEDFLDEDFVVISGDAITDIDLTQMIENHKKKNALVSIVLSKVDEAMEYGVAVVDKNGVISEFIEKPNWSEVLSELANTGIYIMKPEIFKYIEKDREVDFSKDVFPHLLSVKEKICGFQSEDYWCDIGDVGAYLDCVKDVLDGEVLVDIPARKLTDGFYAGKNVKIDDSAMVHLPCYIGKNVTLGKGAIIGPYCAVGDGAVVGEKSIIQNSIIDTGAKVGSECEIAGSILCPHAIVQNNAVIEEGAVVGSHSVIENGCHIKPGVKIWPSKSIHQHETVSENVEFHYQLEDSAFLDGYVAGKMNRDISSEFLIALSYGFSDMLKQGKIAIARSEGNVTNTIYYLLTGALQNAGSAVYDFDVQCMSALRHGISDYGLDGGIYIENTDEVYLSFFDSEGVETARSDFKKLRRMVIRRETNDKETIEAGDNIKIYDYRLRYEHFLVSQIKTPLQKKRICLFADKTRHKKMMISLAHKLNVTLDIYHTKQQADSRIDYNLYFLETDRDLMLCDSQKNVLSHDIFLFLCMLVKTYMLGLQDVVVPIHMPSVMKEAAIENGCVVISSSSHRSDYMQAVKKHEGDIAFYMVSDPILAGFKILEYCEQKKLSLSQLFSLMPESYIQEIELPCRDRDKGKVMQTLCQAEEEKELTEGIKIYHKQGWVLFLPSNNAEQIKIISEGISMESAKEICDDYVELIKKYVDEF